MTEQPSETSEDVRKLIDSDDELRSQIEALPDVTHDDPGGAAPERALKARGDIDIETYYGVADNDCGQAAIATVIGHWGYNLGNMGPSPWPNDRAIAQIKADGFGPDVLFGHFGTSPNRIRDAFAAYGDDSQASVGFAGVGGWGWEQCWETLKSWVAAGWPIPVLVQANYIMNAPTAIPGHWPVVVGIDSQHVRLTGVSRASDPIELTHNGFLSAWNYLGGWAPGYHHVFVTGAAG